MKKTRKNKLTESNQSIWSYIKLQMLLAFRPNNSQKKSKIIIGWALKALILILVLFVVYIFVKRLTTQTTAITGKTISIAFFTLFEIGLLIYSISAQIRRLYKPSDIRIISVLPYTSFQRYLGEIIAIYLRLAIYTVVIFWPVSLAFGFGSKIVNVSFVFSSLLSALALPLIPFSLSLVICVPFMFLGEWLKNKHIVKLIIFVVLFAGFLTAYAILLNVLTDRFIHAKFDKEVIDAIIGFLTNLNKPYNPSYFVSEICLANKIYINLPILIGITAALGAIGILITKPLYHKFTTNGVVENEQIIKHVKIHDGNPYKAIFLKEIKQILRTPTYAYFYVGVAFTMPILTWMLADVIKKLGEAQIGSNMFFGFALLIVTVIVSLIGAYSANAISRESKQFYITKVSPLSYRKQLIIKALVNFTISFIGLLLCILVLGVTSMGGNETNPGLSGTGLAFIFGISTFFLIGMTFNGINIDLVKPRIDMLSGHVNDTNILIQLIINIIICGLISVFAITVGTINQQFSLYSQLIILGVIFLYAVINFVIWFFTCEKKYRKIELK